MPTLRVYGSRREVDYLGGLYFFFGLKFKVNDANSMALIYLIFTVRRDRPSTEGLVVTSPR